MKTLAFGILASVVAATGAIAGTADVSKDKTVAPPQEIPCFRDHEFQLDIFGSYLNLAHGDNQYDHHRNSGQDGGGGGVGLNYFFTRNFGLGVDGDFDTNRGGVANYTGKLIIRFPIENGHLCLAPYIFGGGGGESFFNENQWYYNHRYDHQTQGTWMCGGGVEFRVTPRIGVFTEGRYTWTGGSNNNGDNASARLGVRFAF